MGAFREKGGDRQAVQRTEFECEGTGIWGWLIAWTALHCKKTQQQNLNVKGLGFGNG